MPKLRDNSTCGNSLSGVQKPGYQAPPNVYQAQPVETPQQYAPQDPVYAQPQQHVIIHGPIHAVVRGQMLHPDGRCAHAVQTNEFTCLGIFLAIILFPIGILCCLVITKRRCIHCGALLG